MACEQNGKLNGTMDELYSMVSQMQASIDSIAAQVPKRQFVLTLAWQITIIVETYYRSHRCRANKPLFVRYRRPFGKAH